MSFEINKKYRRKIGASDYGVWICHFVYRAGGGCFAMMTQEGGDYIPRVMQWGAGWKPYEEPIVNERYVVKTYDGSGMYTTDAIEPVTEILGKIRLSYSETEGLKVEVIEGKE